MARELSTEWTLFSLAKTFRPNSPGVFPDEQGFTSNEPQAFFGPDERQIKTVTFLPIRCFFVLFFLFSSDPPGLQLTGLHFTWPSGFLWLKWKADKCSNIAIRFFVFSLRPIWTSKDGNLGFNVYLPQSEADPENSPHELKKMERQDFPLHFP